MFALLAAIVFFLGLVGVAIGTLNIVLLGLFLVALHLVVPVGVPYANRQ